MPTTASSSELVVLRNGPAVPVALLRRLWALEDRGCRFTLEDDAVRIRPASAVTPEDLAYLRAHRQAVRELVAYVERTVQ